MNVNDLEQEIIALLSENVAKDAALRQIKTHEEDAQLRGEVWNIANAALSTTPPVCVPVDVVAKLVGALELFGEHYADCHGVIAHAEQCDCGLAASIALAAPFLAKGESRV